MGKGEKRGETTGRGREARVSRLCTILVPLNFAWRGSSTARLRVTLGVGARGVGRRRSKVGGPGVLLRVARRECEIFLAFAPAVRNSFFIASWVLLFLVFTFPTALGSR